MKYQNLKEGTKLLCLEDRGNFEKGNVYTITYIYDVLGQFVRYKFTPQMGNKVIPSRWIIEGVFKVVNKFIII